MNFSAAVKVNVGAIRNDDILYLGFVILEHFRISALR